jgi:hypothetical protein
MLRRQRADAQDQLMNSHVHDDPMRPNGSDLLKADRLKAGGIKPGTWALKPRVVALRQVFGRFGFRSCLSCGPKGRLVTKIRRACRGSVLLGGLRRSFVTLASGCETRRFDSSAGWHARANERPRTPPLRQSPASPIVSSPPRPPVRALCAAVPRDCRAARQPAPSASGRQTIPTRRRGTSAHHGLLRSRDIRARRAVA